MRQLLVFIFISGFIGVTMGASQATRQQLISAYIYNLSKNIIWEQQDSSIPFQIVVYDNLNVRGEIEVLLEQRRIFNRPISVLYSTLDSVLLKSEVVFIPKKNINRHERVFNLLQGENILLITEEASEYDLEMINLMANPDGSFLFEINKENVLNQSLKILPEVVLLGGSKVDIRQMFDEVEEKIESAQLLISEKESLLVQRNSQLEMQQLAIAESRAEVLALSTEKQIVEYILDSVKRNVDESQGILEEKYLIINQQEEELGKQSKEMFNQQVELSEYKGKIQSSQNELSNLISEIKNKQFVIEEQNNELGENKELIEVQKRLLYLFVIFFALLAAFIVTNIRALKARKNRNVILEEKVSERTRELNNSNKQLVKEIDIRKIRERELLTSRNQVQQLFDNSPIAIIEEDLSEVKKQIDKISLVSSQTLLEYFTSNPSVVSKIAISLKAKDANKEAVTFFNADSKAHLTEQMHESYHPESVNSFVQEMEAIRQNKQSMEQETVLRTLKGEKRNVILRWVVLPGFEKSYGKVLVSIKDITSLKQAETELLRYQNHLEELVKERTNEIQQMNEELQSANEELYDKNDELQTINTQLTEKQEEVQSLNVELKNINAQLFNSNEELMVQKQHLEDTLKKLKEAQGQLIQSEKMASVGVLTAGIAHEIINPVNYINSGLIGFKKALAKVVHSVGNIQLAIQEEESERLTEKVNAIEKAGDMDYYLNSLDKMMINIQTGTNRTVEIISSLRVFSRSGGDQFQLTNIHEGIDSTLVMLYHQYKSRIEVFKNYGEIPEWNCMPGKLNQVFMNVLSNAIQSIEQKGKIIISTRILDDQSGIEISIKDSGKGIEKENLNKIFDPFYTTKQVGKGTGLGLSLSYGIIKEHQGAIHVDSEPGKGTNFIIRLPFKNS